MYSTGEKVLALGSAVLLGALIPILLPGVPPEPAQAEIAILPGPVNPIKVLAILQG